jgi:hypothetical protein
MLATKLGVAHALGIALEVGGCLANGFGQFGRGGFQGTEIADQFLDVSVVEFVLMAQDPLSLVGILARVKEAGQVPEMLTGVE